MCYRNIKIYQTFENVHASKLLLNDIISCNTSTHVSLNFKNQIVFAFLELQFGRFASLKEKGKSLTILVFLLIFSSFTFISTGP